VTDRVRALKELIEALDAVRVGRYVDLSRVERLLTELALTLPYSWEELKRDALAILTLPATAPEYPRLSKLERLAARLARLNLLVMAAALASYVARAWLPAAPLDVVALLLLLAALVIANVAFVLRAHVSLRISAIYAERVGELERLGSRIRATVNYLIRLLRRELVARKYRLDAFTLKLWMDDYAGISVVRKPSWLSPRYVVRLV